MKKVLIVDFDTEDSTIETFESFLAQLDVTPVCVSTAHAPNCIEKYKPIGIIIAGGNSSTLPELSKNILDRGIPILATRSAMHWVTHQRQGTVGLKGTLFGDTPVHLNTGDPLFAGLADKQNVWTNNSHWVTELPIGFSRIAHDNEGRILAMCDRQYKLWAVQFCLTAPKPDHYDCRGVPIGARIISNFVSPICSPEHLDQSGEIECCGHSRTFGEPHG